MNITAHTPVGEIVKANFKTAALFQDNQIDYCCGGIRSLEEACRIAGVDTLELLGKISETLQAEDPDSEYINSLHPGALADYIVQRHHTYVRKNIPVLEENLVKIAEVHGEKHPELYEVRDQFRASAGDLSMHMQKEELVLFPYIRQLEKARDENGRLPKSHFGSVTGPIGVMIAEHQNEGNRFAHLSEITGNFQVPEDACTTYEVAFKQLSDFVKDLHRHIHLENNILFPKTEELENSLREKKTIKPLSFRDNTPK